MKWIAALVVAALSIAAPMAAPRAAAADAADPQGILFVGSSIFHRWTNLQAQMAPLPISNIAFDGAQTDDMLRIVDAYVLPKRPKVVAYYCGSNDVSAGEPAAAIVGRIRQFIDRVTAALPGTSVVFMSVNRAPEKRDRWDVVDAVNRQIEQWASTNTRVVYIDVNPALFNADGSSRLELFMTDRLHLRPPAYEEFTRILKPVLTKALSAQSLR
jgi:lysophospholipase L1-like esterase